MTENIIDRNVPAVAVRAARNFGAKNGYDLFEKSRDAEGNVIGQVIDTMTNTDLYALVRNAAWEICEERGIDFGRYGLDLTEAAMAELL